MRVIYVCIICCLTFLEAEPRELIPHSKTEFTYINKKGASFEFDLTGKDFILVSVREEESDSIDS